MALSPFLDPVTASKLRRVASGDEAVSVTIDEMRLTPEQVHDSLFESHRELTRNWCNETTFSEICIKKERSQLEGSIFRTGRLVSPGV